MMNTQDQSYTSSEKTPTQRIWGVAGLNSMNGFLPQKNPDILKDPEFNQLNQLLSDMPVIIRHDQTKAGEPGLLAKNAFRKRSTELPDHSPQFEKWITMLDSKITEEAKNDIAFKLATAFRDYQYLKMGFLFEPVHQGSLKASAQLPANIANPLMLLAQTFHQQPWLEYASGYVLMNSQFQKEIKADKVRLIRQWHGGSDEYFFQTIHSIIEWETPNLFQAIQGVIDGISSDNNDHLYKAMLKGIEVSELMLSRLKLMTKLSRPSHYAADVRPQIQGLVGNCGDGKLFDEQGVFFNSCYTESGNGVHLNQIRGQTGAQSSVIPLLDNILGITDFYAKGDNPLTSMLREFRHYRPKSHTELLHLVETQQHQLNIRQVLKQKAPLLLAQWTGVVCQFREYHFYLAMAYIVKPGKLAPKSQSRAIGTGGSPTPKYLPQHVSESLQALQEALAAVPTATLDTHSQPVYSQWLNFLDRSVSDNQQRSAVVGDYLEGSKSESELTSSISEAATLVDS